MINPFYLGNSTQNPNRINAQFAEAMLGYYQAPNAPGDLNNFTAVRPSSTSGPQYTARIDHQLTGANSLALRCTVIRSSQVNGAQAAYRLADHIASETTNCSAGLTSVIRPNLVNEFRFGWNGVNGDYSVTPARNLIGELGIQMPVQLPNTPLVNRIPTLTFTGNGAFFGMGYATNIGGDGTPSIFENGSRSISDAITWQNGKLTIKAGYNYQRMPMRILYVGYPAGLLTYNGRTATNSTGYSAADLLLGLPASSTLEMSPPISDSRAMQEAAFLQTDWRATSRLTLNLGLRWEVRTPQYAANGEASTFDPVLGKIVVADPGGNVSASAYPQLLSAYAKDIVTATQAGWPQNLVTTNWLNLCPRFGMAYSFDQRSEFVLRGGYGIFYSYPPEWMMDNSASIPYGASSSTSSTAANLLSNANPFRVGLTATPALTGVAPDFHNAYNQQWNLAIERVLFGKTTLSLAYVGNRGVHLMGQQNLNAG